MSKILDVPLDGPPAEKMPKQPAEVVLLGLRAIPIEPGDVEIAFRMPKHLVNVSFGTVPADLAINSDRMKRVTAIDGGSAWFPVGTECKLRCTNSSSGLLLEVEPSKLDMLLSGTKCSRTVPSEFRGYSFRSESAVLSRHLLSHLRFASPNRLYVEGLSLAILASELSVSTTKSGSTSAIGADPRIARAIDYVEAHLGENLSVAQIAAAAAMSPSWFQTAFKATTGQPVFAHVRERRLERARILLADKRLSLAQIAFACGFSSHSHMTRLFTARFGVSPRDMR